jgi:hypothetical protein
MPKAQRHTSSGICPCLDVVSDVRVDDEHWKQPLLTTEEIPRVLEFYFRVFTENSKFGNRRIFRP